MVEKKTIAYPGIEGSFSFLAASEVFPTSTLTGYTTFSETLLSIKEKHSDYAILPVENSEAGRVADLHILLPDSGLYITGEHYKRVEHHLVGINDSNLKTIKTVYSHPQALAQCSKFIENLGAVPVKAANTAIAAREISENKDITVAAIASEAAAKKYNLKLLQKNIENSNTNTTRFLIISPQMEIPSYNAHEKTIVSLMIHLKNEPASLYNALGAFADNNINLTRIESYIRIGNSDSAKFMIDIESHIESEQFKSTANLLKSKTKQMKILGVYKASPYRNGRSTPSKAKSL